MNQLHEASGPGGIPSCLLKLLSYQIAPMLKVANQSRFKYIYIHKGCCNLYLNYTEINMQSTSLFKRKWNRVPINFLSKRQVRSRITKKVVEVSLPEHNTTLTDTSNSWDNDDNNMDTGDPQYYQEDDTSVSVSAHTKRKQKLAEKWSFLRKNMHKMMVQSKALPPNQKCFSCDVGNADIRCEQCGPLLMCQTCCTVIHSKLHYHHFPEIWQVY